MHLVGFWAPFLLLHLGGPDAITAFSMEDNQLWLRHALGLVVQVALAIHIFVRYYPVGPESDYLWAPFVMVFLAGLFKYAERTYALWRGSMAGLRKSMVGDSDPDPDFAKFIWRNRGRSRLVDANTNTRAIWMGRELFEKFKGLFVDSIFSYRDRKEVRDYFLVIEHEEAFRAVEMELSFAYDVLFTKASVSRCFRGFLLRTLGLLLTSSSLGWLFSHKDFYSQFHDPDVAVTQVLLVGAVVLDMASLVRLLFSSWTLVLLRPGGRHPRWEWLGRVVMRSYPMEGPKWSNRLSQYSLLTSCIRDLRPTTIQRSMTAIGLKDLWDRYHHTDHIPVEDDLKRFIFRDLKAKSPRFEPPELFTSLGEWVLTLAGSLPENLQAAEFDESILVWHIATELSYHSYMDGTGGGQRVIPDELRITRQLSNYMLYLLVMCPHMLFSVALMGEKRYGDTRADLKKLILLQLPPSGGGLRWSERDASCRILSLDTCGQTPSDLSKSVLRDAWTLAKKLRVIDSRWQILLRAWVEMLCYAAVHCLGYHHAAQLSQGGELLTFAWFLMAHLGVVEHYRGLRWVKPL